MEGTRKSQVISPQNPVLSAFLWWRYSVSSRGSISLFSCFGDVT